MEKNMPEIVIKELELYVADLEEQVSSLKDEKELLVDVIRNTVSFLALLAVIYPHTEAQVKRQIERMSDILPENLTHE